MPVLAGVVVGTALQVLQPSAWPAGGYAALGASGLLLAALPWAGGRRVQAPLAWALAAAALAFAAAGGRTLERAAGRLDPALEGRDLVVTGVVGALPQRLDTGARFRFELESARLAGRAVALPPGLLLAWYGAVDAMEDQAEARSVRAGERWQFAVRLKAPHGGVNPHGFDVELWLWEQDLGATGYVRAGASDPPPLRLGMTTRHPVEAARQRVRDAIFARVPDARLAGIVAALVVGDQSAIERGDWDVFRATGVAHLMSISGLHITMFAWAAAALLQRLWRRWPRACLACPAQHAGLAGGVLLATGYALFSGWGLPSQRTVLMLACVGALRLSGRRWPWPATWLLAFAAVAVADPWALWQAGFWLSFVAVGVLFASGPRAAAAQREAAAGPHAVRPAPAGGRSRLRRTGQALARSLAGGAREQLTVTLALAPLTLLLFGQVSLVGLLANALAIPWVTLVLTPLAMAGVLVAPAWDLAAGAASLLAGVLGALAALPGAVLWRPVAPVWAAALGVAGGLLLVLPLAPRLRLLGLPLLVPVLAWSVPRPAQGQFELLFADVGQGNAVLVRTATHALLYDAGPRWGPDSDAGQRVLVPLLRARGESLDMLVLSHRDTDHTGGAAAVLATQPGAVLVAGLEAGHLLWRLRPGRACLAGTRWTWDAVGFELLHPRAEDFQPGAKPNSLSCVLRIRAGVAQGTPRVDAPAANVASAPAGTALLVGDLEQAQELRLVGEGAPLAADLLMVPHHGSKTSSSGAFLDAVSPHWALVQAGWRNRFGHPAPSVLARYRERGIRVVDSAHCGAATWASAQPDALRCEREADPRPWRHRPP